MTASPPLPSHAAVPDVACLARMRDAVLLVDAAAVVRHANAAAAALLGEAQCVGRRLHELLPALDVAAIAAAGVHVVADASGARWVEASVGADPDGATIVLRDVTAARAEAAHFRRLAEIVEATTDYVGMGTSDGASTYLNAAARAMLGIGGAPLPPGMTAGTSRPAWARERFYRESLPVALRTGAWSGESAVIDASGHEIPVSQVLLAHRGPEGVVDHISSILRDLRPQKQVEATLRASERLHRAVVREFPDGAVSIVDREMRIVLCDGGGLAALGIDGAALLGRRLDEIEAPEAMRVLVPAARRVLAGERITFQLPVRGRTLELRGVPLTDDGAAARGALILGIDVTERERARAALEASEQKLRTAVELATEGIYEWDVVNDRVIGSTKLSRHLGYGPGTASPTVSAWFELVHPDDAPRARALLDRHLEGRSPGYETEYRVRAANGEWRWLHDRAQVVERDADGRPLWVLGANADITDRKRTEGALRAIAATSGAPGSDAKLFSELVERLATMLELRAACIAERDAERSTVLRLLGSWAEGAAHDERTVDIAGTLLAPVLDGGDAPSAGGPTIATTLWGIDADDHTIVPLRDDRGLTIGLLLAVGGGARLDGGMAGSLLQTIAARATGELVRRRAEARLRERERELADAQRIGRIGGYAWHGPEGRLVWTDETYRLLGHVPGTVVASAALFREAIHPDDAATVRAGLDHVMATRAPHWRAEYRIRRADDGSVRWIASQGEFEYDATGAVRHVRGVHVDITDQRVLEERLRQSQKLEAVGQLAGGLAHDFNNLLTVVRGHARFLLRALPEGSEARRDADAIRVASERAAGLTRQLLTLSRRDASVPRRIAADTIIARYAELLGRVLGEHVALELHLGAGTTRAILLDPMHLEQVLLNLGLNARDAMADSGTLTITTTYLGPAAVDFPAPRGVVRLQVRDTGAGMDPATVARAFEPFFTTKPSGHGTGIGLATVHNIVEQGGGRIWIDSVPAAGTTVTLVFPVTDGAPESLDEAPAAGPSGEPARGTVLLVEDEPDVRALARRTLEDAGYDVLVAEHGLDAVERWLEAAAAGRQVDVLVSDIRMPRMTGRELARALRAEDGELPIVLMSGYDDPDAADADARIEGAFRFVAKPFGPEALVRAVATVLRDQATARALAASLEQT